MFAWLLEMIMSLVAFIMSFFGVDIKKKNVHFEDGGDTSTEPPATATAIATATTASDE